MATSSSTTSNTAGCLVAIPRFPSLLGIAPVLRLALTKQSPCLAPAGRSFHNVSEIQKTFGPAEVGSGRLLAWAMVPKTTVAG